MTNPGDSDEWWKQYGGTEGRSEFGGPDSVPQYPPTEQHADYPSAPNYPGESTPPSPQPQYPPQQQPYPPQQPYPQPNYGYPNSYQPYGPPVQGTNGLAIGAMISSLLTPVTCGLGAIVGIILGAVALNQVKQSGQDGRGMALAGIWIGVGMVALAVVWIVLVIASL
ncbi:DUF4190 domain-containing protein [Nocardia sp. CNY236]|uniref:DUF4190 domain-containing protein n=1 Tax=Nocardia sp. CNY236 TaxID=1169152 RepID=UPI00040C464A|nr:DUF4190 domain-containing protein [Nocardia sp. CNY236]